ncbi:Protein rolling stone [Durusdinium trenchii]|uniref:Protein rolling stone n=1 Tax=Durusdinium trenchii TaxID=1381693 RepID=A0ABP0PJ94_9DINO
MISTGWRRKVHANVAANSTEPPSQLIFGWTVPLLVWLLLLGLELFLVGTAGVSAEIFVSVVALVGLVEVLLMLVVGWRFFIYLTRWSFILETLYFCVAVYVTFKARTLKRLSSEALTPAQEQSRLPKSVRLMSLLWTLTFPISVLVCLAFWTLINPVWDQKMRPGFVLLTEHFVNMWIFIFEFLINRNTFYLKHGVIIYAYALLYSLWSVIHFLAKVGVSPDMACHDYPLDECPIYPVLDWHHPARTVVVVLGVCLMTVLLQLVLWKCTRLRDRRFKESSSNATHPETSV